MPNWPRVLAYLAATTDSVERDSEKLRILVQGMNYAPEIIGVGKYTTELAQFLAIRSSVEVVAAVPHYPGWSVPEPYKNQYGAVRDGVVSITRCPVLMRRNGAGLWRLIAPLSFALAAAPIILLKALRQRPNIVLCIEPTLFGAPAALLAAALSGAQSVLHVQDLEVDAAFATGHLGNPRTRRIAQWCERRLLRRFDMVVAICDSMAGRLRAKGVDPSKIVVIRNWVDRERLRPTASSAALRAALRIPRAAQIVLYAGHLGQKQGLPILIDACRRLAAHQHVHVLIAGAGPLASMVEAAAAALPNLTLMPLQPPERLGDLLALADLHVLPQDAAAADLVFPSKLGGLLVSGKPIVVTANHGTELASWLSGAATIVPAGDPAALADAVVKVIATPDLEQRERAAVLASQLAAEILLPRFETVLRETWSRGAMRAKDPFEVWYPTEAEKLI